MNFRADCCRKKEFSCFEFSCNVSSFTRSSVSQDLPSVDSFIACGHAQTKPDLSELRRQR